MTAERDEEGVGPAGQGHDEVGAVEEVFEDGAVHECRSKSDHRIVGLGRVAIRADELERFEDFFAGEIWEELPRVLEGSDRDSVPEVYDIDHASEGRTDPAIAIEQEPRRPGQCHFGTPKSSGRIRDAYREFVSSATRI